MSGRMDKNGNVTYSEMPNWPTSLKGVSRDGRLMGIDNSVWALRSVPMSPIADAKDSSKKILGGKGLMEAFSNLAELAQNRMGRRTSSKSSYRQFQLLTVDMPRFFRAPLDHPLRRLYDDSYGKMQTKSRLCLFAVRLRDSLGNGGTKSAVDSVVNTLVFNEPAQLSDYDRDYEVVTNALDRAGLREARTEEILLADAWWNRGDRSDTPFIPHADHMHVFPTNDSLRVIEEGSERGDWSKKDCRNWPDGIGAHSISMASMRGLDVDPGENMDVVHPAGAWVSNLIEAGAIAVSMRGLVEPPKITRQELRRNKKSYLDDINERQRAGKMEKAEQEERLNELSGMESAYAGRGAPATLVDTSVVVAFNGRPDGTIELGQGSLACIDTMDDRQLLAWSETTLCSRQRANPNLQDLPASAVAYSGVNGLSLVGDPSKMVTEDIDVNGNKTGGSVSVPSILAGITEFDRQQAWLSGTAASGVDKEPLMLCAGTTGSGKSQAMTSKLPVPDGFIQMKDVSPGTMLLGRRGKPVKVESLSPIFDGRDLYRMDLSDGQAPVSDYDHQWVVSSHADRNAIRSDKRRRALENWRKAHEDVATLRRAGAGAAPGDESTLAQLLDIVARLDLRGQRWISTASLRSALHMVEAPYRVAQVETTRRGGKVTKTDPRLLFDLEAGLRACIAGWESHTGSNASRWAAQTKTRVEAAKMILAEGRDPQQISAADTARLLAEYGAVVSAGTSTESNILKAVRDREVEVVKGVVTVVLDTPEEISLHSHTSLYPTGQALELLALRLEQQYAVSPRNEYAEHRMTTGELIEAMKDSQQKWAIRVADAIDLPEAELPLSPYALGAWLGDGFTGKPMVVSEDPQVIDEILAEGHEVVSRSNNHGDSETTFIYRFGDSFRDGLKKLDLWTYTVRGERIISPKRIPMLYKRASIAQRMAVLQGLMDTDGTINKSGSCVLALSDPDLAADALELVRSLGIKASATVSPAYYTKTDEETGEKVRVYCKDSTSIAFTTTTQRVFRLDRKSARLPVTVRESEKWIYIDSIEQVESEPSRCLTVSDPDAVYLTGEGFLPTSNTQALLWWAYQGSEMGQPQVILDPKPGSDHTEAIKGKNTLIASLDELSEADGIFDPLRFAATPQAGIDMATSLLTQVNPWGDNRENYSTPLAKALYAGVQSGATCVGEALLRARGLDRMETQMIDQVFDLAEASPMFRACVGMNNSSPGMRTSDGITYIKVGDANLELPAQNQSTFEMTPTERASLALIRMMIFGSSMALTGRNGVLHADEAWTFLKAGPQEIERLGRLARSQGVLPILYTQRVTDATEHNLQNYISRGLILGIRDPEEAYAACALFGLEPTPERIERITAGSTKGGTVGDEGDTPNFDSLRPLREGAGGRVIRGSVAIYSDLSGDRANTIEIPIPGWFFRRSSTNTVDQARRKAQAAMA